jgi:plasmid stability protein
MPVTLSIKNAPDEVVQRLRQRAERHHRSLQGELLAIVEDAVRFERELSPAELLAEVRRLGVRTPSDSA